MDTPELSAHAKPVFERIIALRQIEGSLGVHSQRTQRNLLLTLEDNDLADVARALEYATADREEMREASALLGGGR